jgi:predicted AAA+ superfamily ATPase
LKEHLKKKQITVITGMRRTGKTTLAKQLLSGIVSKNKIYVDLERVDNREIFLEKNYDSIVRSLSGLGLDFSKKCFIVIDEIQLVPEIASVLKYLYDTFDIKFVVTGSSSYYLKNLFSESLAGRKKLFELFPLDFGEFLFFKQVSFSKNNFLNADFSPAEFARLKSFYGEFVEFGGFPEVVLAKSVSDKRDFISDIVSSYVNIDIKTLADFRDSKNVYNLLKLLAARIGSRLDYSKLSSISGLSRQTVLNYADFFEKTFLIKRLAVFSKKPDKEIVKAQKLFFCDNGIANFLVELSSGAQFENAVFNQLKHKGELNYYSLKTGKEIDFVLDKSAGFEVKESPIEQDLKNLKLLAKTAGLKKAFLIGKNQVPKFSKYIWAGNIK